MNEILLIHDKYISEHKPYIHMTEYTKKEGKNEFGRWIIVELDKSMDTGERSGTEGGSITYRKLWTNIEKVESIDDATEEITGIFGYLMSHGGIKSPLFLYFNAVHFFFYTFWTKLTRYLRCKLWNKEKKKMKNCCLPVVQHIKSNRFTLLTLGKDYWVKSLFKYYSTCE